MATNTAQAAENMVLKKNTELLQQHSKRIDIARISTSRTTVVDDIR